MKLKYLRDPIQTIIYFKYTWISSSLIFVVYIYSSSQNCGFSSSLLWMWELDYKESWAPKNWCFWTVVLEKILKSPLGFKIKPVNPKGNNPEYSLEGLMLKLKLQYFGHLCKELIHWKSPWCWERLKAGEGDDKRMRLLDGITDLGYGFGWTLVVGNEQGGLACCGSWGCKASDTTEWLNWTELKIC